MHTDLDSNFGFKQNWGGVEADKDKRMRKGTEKGRIEFGTTGDKGFEADKLMKISGRILDPEVKEDQAISKSGDKIYKKTLLGRDKLTHIKVNLNGTEAILSVNSLKKRTGLSDKQLSTMSGKDVLDNIKGKVRAEVQSTKRNDQKDHPLKDHLLDEQTRLKTLAHFSSEEKKALSELSSNSDFMLKFAKGIKENSLPMPQYLKLAHESLKTDKDFVEGAVKIDPYFPIPVNLRSNEKIGQFFLEKALDKSANSKNQSANLQFLTKLDPDLRNKLILEYVEKAETLDKTAANYLHTKESLEAAIKKDPSIVAYLKSDQIALAKDAIESNSEILKNPYLFQQATREWMIKNLDTKILPDLKKPPDNPEKITTDFTQKIINITNKVGDKITREQALDICTNNSEAFKLYMGTYNHVFDTFEPDIVTSNIQEKPMVDSQFVQDVLNALINKHGKDSDTYRLFSHQVNAAFLIKYNLLPPPK